MKKLLLTGLAVVGVLFASAPARACWPCCCPPPLCCLKWVETTVTCYEPTWQEREVTCTINKLVQRTEMVKQTCTVMVPVWTEKKETCLVPTFVPRQVEREELCCRLVPVTRTDPCTGCTFTTCKPETYTRKVTCTVMDCVPVKKETTVKACCYKPDQKTYEVAVVRCHWQPQTVTYKERVCVLVPVQTKVMVLACCP